ncbi:S-layer homology domain-containing protein [Ureibacillus sinduriensis]|uniref:S-layer homology domain-containing protein n=1 Tax=Ureibacillus sinduriensis TaxID=561440 RepID=UPI00068F1719|nr:S-layer homology domain-containing protein [Ureibacillus sinduriensis]
MKKTLSVLAAASLLLPPQFILGQHVSANDQLFPQLSEDAYWDNGGKFSLDASNYVGTSTSPELGEQKSALKFNLADITGSISKATLRIYITNKYSDSNVIGHLPSVTLYGVESDSSWAGSQMPSPDSPPLIENDTDFEVGWKEFDVTTFVHRQLTGDGEATFFMTGSSEPGVMFEYSSDDYADPSYHPQLVLEMQPEPAQQPIITGASTMEDTLSVNGLIISTETGTMPTHYKITDIAGGILYRNDGASIIHNGDFITSSEGLAGLKYLPAENANDEGGGPFTFKVWAALDNTGSGLSESAAQAIINVSEVNDDPVANNDVLDSIDEDSGERVIPLADLLANDTAGPSNENGQELTIETVNLPIGGTVRLEGTNVVFTTAPNFSGNAGFSYILKDNGNPDPKMATGTVSFTVNPKIDIPTVTNAETAEDTQSTDGLVITRNAVDGAEVTHFKITGITGGMLYQNDGATEIKNGDFITASEGGSGLKFTPAANAYGDAGFGFNVQAANGSSNNSELSEVAEAIIKVTEVNDSPMVVGDTLEAVGINTPKVSIPFTKLLENDHPGNEFENGQELTIIAADNAIGGTVTLVDNQIEFVPDMDFSGTASFTYTVRDNGQTNGADAFKTATALVEFEIKDNVEPVITLQGEQNVFLQVGTEYQEPGYAAEDNIDGDLTGEVTVSGTVDSNVLGSYTLRYHVSDSNGNDTEVTRTVQVVSADLVSISTQAGNLQPTFTADTVSYTMNVANQVSVVDVAANPVDPTATVTVNGITVNIDEISNVNLRVGQNPIVIVVTTQGGFTKTYTLNVIRQSAPTEPSTPGGTTQPSTPGGTTQPSTPGETTQPSTPSETTQPSTPGETTQPSTPGGTTQPTTPGETTQPTPSPVPNNIFNSNVIESDTDIVEVIQAKVAEANKGVQKPVPYDVKGHWAEKTVSSLTKLEIINGYTDGAMKPDQVITRGEYVSILSRIFNVNGTKPATFNDVNGHWARNAINDFASAGIISGYGNGKFQPNKAITREEMVVILSRLINLNDLPESSSPDAFTDRDAITPYAKDAIDASLQLGIITGQGGNKFNPQGLSTRAETMTVIINILNLHPEIKLLLDSLN